MMRLATVMAWLRWRLLLNLLRPTKRRDALERASRALQVIGPIVVFLIFIPGVILAGFVGGLAGWYLPQTGSFHRPVLAILRTILSMELLLALLAPLLRAAQGSTLNLTRLLLLPVPVRALYASEALGAFVNPWLAILTTSSLLLPVGMAVAGELRGAATALLAAAGILAFLSGLETLASSSASLLFRDRRRGEIATFALMASLAGAAFLPGLLATFGPVKRRLPDAGSIEEKAAQAAPEKGRQPEAPGWSGKPLPLWALAYPPELYARCVALSADRRPGAALLPLLPLLLWACGAHAIGSRLHRRLLETPEVSSSRRRGSGAVVSWPQFPGLSDAASAVAVSQVHLVFRTVQGKIQFCVLPVVILVLGLLWHRHPPQLTPSGPPLPVGLLLAALGILLAMMTLEGTLLNQFAMDRAGLTLEFLSPISDRELILGKAAAGAFLLASRALPAMLVAALVAPGGSIFLWLSLPFVALSLVAVMAPLGAILSALFPRAVDLGKIVKQNQPHPLAAILGMFGNLFAMVPILGLVAGALFLLQSAALALLFVMLWTGVALLISLPLMRLAENLLARRRENLALVAQGR
jgi:hypothetical protein